MNPFLLSYLSSLAGYGTFLVGMIIYLKIKKRQRIKAMKELLNDYLGAAHSQLSTQAIPIVGERNN